MTETDQTGPLAASAGTRLINRLLLALMVGVVGFALWGVIELLLFILKARQTYG